MLDLPNIAEELFGKTCVGIASMLEFHALNRPYHHIFLSLEDRIIDDIDRIDSMISAEIPPQLDLEWRQLVRELNIHRRSPYCRGRTRNRRCRLKYDDMTITLQTYIAQTCKNVPCRRRDDEDLNGVSYNADFTGTYSGQISVEITEGGVAVGHLMEYAFKPPKRVDLRVDTGQERGSSSINVSRDNRNEFIL